MHPTLVGPIMATHLKIKESPSCLFVGRQGEVRRKPRPPPPPGFSTYLQFENANALLQSRSIF